MSGEFSVDSDGNPVRKNSHAFKAEINSDSNEADNSYYRRYDEKQKRKFEGLGGARKQQEIADTCTESSKAVVKFWVMRARLRQKVQIQVEKIIESQSGDACLYCGNSYSLQIELIQNIEDLFFMFLKETGATMTTYLRHKWQRFFEENACFRTVCQECAEEIRYFNAKEKRRWEKKDKLERKQFKSSHGGKKGTTNGSSENYSDDTTRGKSIDIIKKTNKLVA